MPDFPIVDAHVHLYDPALLRYSWMRGAPAIDKSHLLADFDRACGEVAVEAFVFAEVAADPGQHLAEARFADARAAQDPRLAAILAPAPLERGAAVAEDLAALAAMPRVKGIRRLIQGEADPGMCLAPEFLAGLRLLPRYGFSFDICVRHFALVYGLELARRCPDTLFVLDHIGKPDIRHGLREPWRGQLRELARLPNVMCKLSGVVTEADHASWTPATVRPYIEHALDCFGFSRTMFASDWPVSSLTHGYGDWAAIVDDIVAAASPDEKRALFRDTARRAYRLG